MEENSHLEHFGVKGMKWGVRRAELNKTNKAYSSRQRSADKEEYGKRSVKRINRMMNEGKSRAEALAKEDVRAVRKEWIKAGVAITGIMVAKYGAIALAGAYADSFTSRPSYSTAPRTTTINARKPRRGAHKVTTL